MLTYNQVKARCEMVKAKQTPRRQYSYIRYLNDLDKKHYTEKEIDILNQIEKRGFIYGSKC